AGGRRPARQPDETGVRKRTMNAAPRPYCLLHQNGRTLRVTGEVRRCDKLAEMARPRRGGPPLTVSMVPYAQLRERGFKVHDGGEPIITLVASEVEEIALDSLGEAGDATIVMDEPVAFSL